MSYRDFSKVGFEDSRVDAFTRLRVSQGNSIFNSQHQYGELSYLFKSTLVTGGAVVEAPNTSSLTLTVTNTIGSKVLNRSHRHYYVAGQSHLIAMTFNFGAGIAGIRKRVGYYDNDDGYFLENLGGVVSLVLRTSTSGAPIDTSITQTAWNVDKMDGTGPSGITVDWTKIQIVEFDMQWLGAGRVRAYLNINGIPYKIHEILNANNLDKIYMQTPHLPCSYEIENLSSGVSDTFMQVCSSVFTEGNEIIPLITRSTSNDFTTVSCTNGSSTHVLSIRPALLFKGRTNKCTAILLNINLDVTNAVNAHYEIKEGATLTASVFTAHSSIDSMMEVSKGLESTYTAGTGTTISEGYITGGTGGSPTLDNKVKFKMQIDPNSIPDTLSIIVGGIGGTTTVVSSIVWEEYH